MRPNNSIILIGAVTQPPKHDEGKKLIFSVGGTIQGIARDTTFYHEVIVPGKTADIINEKIKQHSAVRVAGTLSESTWEKDGERHSKIQIKSFDVDVIHRDEAEDYITDSSGGKRLADAQARCYIIGNIGDAPRVQEKENKITRVRVAVNEGSGEEKKTHWITVVGFDEHAESLAGAQKGDRIYIEGTLISESWRTPEGKNRSSTSIKAERIEYIVR